MHLFIMIYALRDISHPFFRVCCGTKISFKICAHAMETSTTRHNFRICIKIGTTCMYLVVAIFFRFAIKIGPHACVWWGTRLNVCFWCMDEIQSYTCFMHFVYISVPTSRGFQQLLYWISIYAHNYGVLSSKLKVFTIEHGDASTSEQHAKLLHNVPHCINFYTV
jgi:hypothetical protein